MGDHEHGDKHRCFRCEQGEEANRAWEADCMRKYGWFVHYVAMPPHINAHTHGFGVSWGHPDFQIVLAMPQQVSHSIFCLLADQVKEGRKFLPGVRYPIIRDKEGTERDALMALAREGGREVLRILLPDKNWRLPGDAGCAAAFEAQKWVDTDALDGERAPSQDIFENQN